MPSKPKYEVAPTAADLHAQQVLKDPDFQEKLLAIKHDYAKKYPLTTEVARKMVVSHGVYDETTKQQRLYLDWKDFDDSVIRKRILNLSEEFVIDAFWIIECINSPSTIPHLFNKPVIKSRAIVEEDKTSLFIRIWPNTQLGDIAAEWNNVEFAKAASYFKVDSQGKWTRYKKTKNKYPDDPELVYAIFKARRKLSFAKIFMLYQKGELPYYEDKPTNQFNSEKTLTTYYSKYKPTT